ncbi:MAG: hypothetical protein PF569_06835 [Candidatus Woesearchaeota archaeon]|jgi:hypothetical protein|nr:hypothetical protein [Candidatus Woesearchaeota archaeon]
MDEENKVVCKMLNDNKSLAFVSGIHINIRPLNLEHCRKLFNVSLHLMPYLTGLTTNGGFLNKLLDKKDYRLHIGMLDENLLNEDYVYDCGLPDFYLDDIFDYFDKQLVKEPIYQVNNTDLEQSVIDSFRETSWSFIQIKIQKDNLLLEYRPISVQMTSELIVSFHIYSLMLFEYFIERYDDILLTPINTLHKNLNCALKSGSDAIINHDNQEIKILGLHPIEYKQQLIIYFYLKIYFLNKKSKLKI